MFARRLTALGDVVIAAPDREYSGAADINPGANSGRAIYHSGTVGAALTARNGGVSGLAVSQAVDDFGVEGQGWDEMLVHQRWDTAAEVGAHVAAAMLADLPTDPIVLPADTDSGAVEAGFVSVTALSRILDDATVDLKGIDTDLDVQRG